MSSFDIPQSINPVRYQASLGGNVKSTTINNTSEQFQIELAIVKKVFYRKGTLLFSVIKRGSSVSIIGNDTSSATASAPIPVETFGRNSDGKVFGGYRPVKVGSKIAVGYVNGERSAPIVLGVYPDDDESYEIVSPVSFETGEDSDKSVEDIALGSKEITASQNIIYQSGKGDILKTFNGKSLLYINANGSNYMDDINYAYDQIADTRDGNMNPITPRETRAQSWLLVHEDNPEDEETNGHRTRFYVNKNGEFQMVMFSPNNDGDNNLVVFTASKDDGFKLRKQFDTDDLDSSEQYVQFSIGSGNSAVLQSVDKDDASEISMLPNGLQLTTPDNGTMTFNGRSLDSMFGSISSAVDAANAAGDKATTAASAGAIAQSAASDAASQALAASQAGEDAKHAAVDAQAAGEDAKAQALDTKQRIIYYASISNEKDVAVPGKYIIINTDTYIANGTIKTAHIEDGAITNAKIANLAVGTAQLEDAAITRAKIGDLAVGTAQIEDAAITDAKVGDLSANHLKAGTIDFSVISGIHINASEIDVGKIVADQIFVNGLGDISKNLGTVTSGSITGTNVNDDINTVQSGVNDLNNPNLMSVIEKQAEAKQYAGLTSQYNVILERAKDDNISTTDLTTAYTNLDNFMSGLLADTTKASTIDRLTYNNLTYAYNTALSAVQTALGNSFNSDMDNMRSNVSVASQAASNAVIVASQAALTGDNAGQLASHASWVASQAQSAGDNAVSVANNASQAASSAILSGSTATVNADKAVSVANQAQSAGDNATSIANNAASIANNASQAASNATSSAILVGSQANSAIAVQSQATATAQSAADNAFSQATTALDNGNATSQAVTALKDGSTLTIAELGNGLATKVSNSDYASYQTQTASQIAQKVSNSAFSAYQQTTADLISSKVATSDFSAYQATTAKAISSKVESSDFNTYKSQTDDTLQTIVSRSPSNIIKDGGFNSAVVGKTPSGWDWSSNGQIVANPDTVSNLVATGHPVLQINSRTSGNSDIYYGDWFDVQPGDQFYAELKARWSSTSQKGQIVLGVVTKDASGNLNWYSAVTVGSPSTWIKYTGVLTIPAGAVQGRVWLSWQGSAAANQAVQVTDLVVRPAYSTQSDITQTINNIQLGFKNPDGSNFQMNLSSNGVALLDFSKIMLNGSTNITNGTIGTAQIADAAITSAKIASLAVGTAQIANGAITTAQIGSAAVGTAQIANAAVGTAQIANLAVGTAQIGNGAITNAKIGKLAVGTAQIANAAITDAQVGNVSANKLTAGTIDFNTITGKNINASNITTGTLDTNRLNVGKLSALSANLGDVTTGSLKGVDIVAKTFSTPNGSFTTDASGAVVASNLTIRGVTNLVYNAALLGGNGSYIPGWGISNNGYYSNQVLHDGVPSIGWHNNTGAGNWVNFAQTKLYPLNGATGKPFSASVWFLEVGSDTNLKYQLTLAFFDSNGNRIYGGPVDNTWNGIGSKQDWRYVTINNVVSPSTAAYVAIQYWAYNGSGYGLFSSPMLTQTAQSTGYQPDTGNVVNAGIINGSTINASTFNAGNIISDSNNTSSFYPFTIESTGKASTTSFTSMDALRTEMSGGGIRTMYRATNSSGSQYEAYDGNFDGNMISLNSGFTNGKDMSFSQSVTGNQLTGQVLISPLDGINLWGSTQSIHFSGLQMNGTGVTLNSYGNLVGDVGSTWWRIVDSSGNQTANFGTAPGNNTTFPKPIFVDEIGAYSGSNGHALFIHGDDSTSNKTGQMLFRNDGNPQIVSATIYNRTYSSGSTVTVTSYGTLGRITSASKYKLDITKETSLEPANKLLSIDRSSWVDKESAERLADSKTNGTELSEPEINVFRHYGLIAEDLIKAGLDEFVIKGKDGQAEGIEYDRLWTVLIPKIRDLSNQQIDDRMTVSRLEKEIKNLKQEVLSK